MKVRIGSLFSFLAVAAALSLGAPRASAALIGYDFDLPLVRVCASNYAGILPCQTPSASITQNTSTLAGYVTTSARVRLFLTDDAIDGNLGFFGNYGPHGEAGTVGFESGAFSAGFSGWTNWYNVALPALTGGLTLTVTATQGDFLWEKAELEIYGDRRVAVPEPATLALLGLGLAGLGLARRRRAG